MIIFIRKLTFLATMFVSLYSCSMCSVSEKTQLNSGYVIRNTAQTTPAIPEWDSNGYIFFCLCMGETGNKIDLFLGGLAFAKRLNRTLVLPTFERNYQHVRFTDWFKLEAVAKYHRVISPEDFMEYLAPEHWPPEQRLGMCWRKSPTSPEDEAYCELADPGHPNRHFWNNLGVDFARTEVHHLLYSDNTEEWNEMYPPTTYPVLTMMNAPASYPVLGEHRHLQQYLQVADHVTEEAQHFIDYLFWGERKYIGIHLRNGDGWEAACNVLDKGSYFQYMSSPQCLEGGSRRITRDMCFPTDKEIFRSLQKVIAETGIKVVFVATDKRPMLEEIEDNFSKQRVRAVHVDPDLPLVDMLILTKSDHFIGNCISSFTAYVKRARDIEGKVTSFWGFS